MFNAATYCLNITQNYALKNEPPLMQTLLKINAAF